MVSAYDELPRTPANFVALSPLRYLERAAYIYPDQASIIHGAPNFMERNLSALLSICISAQAAGN
ncbi:putative acyl-CoA synthetase [Acinetobacter sp. 1295259]|nr:putative acyl-CoA synthetase [Acinetobacter sp. 1295259]